MRKPQKSWGDASISDRKALYVLVRDLINLDLITWQQLYSEALKRPTGFGTGYEDNFRAGKISRKNAAMIARYLKERFPDAEKYLPIAAPSPAVGSWEAMARRVTSALDIDLHAQLYKDHESVTYFVPPVDANSPTWELPHSSLAFARLRVRSVCSAIVLHESSEEWSVEAGHPERLEITRLESGEHIFQLGRTYRSSRRVIMLMPIGLATRLASTWRLSRPISVTVLDDVALAIDDNPQARAIAIHIKRGKEVPGADWRRDAVPITGRLIK